MSYVLYDKTWTISYLKQNLQTAGEAAGLWFWSWSGSNLFCFLLQIEALKLFSQEELVSWFLEHRNSSRKLSVHVSDTKTLKFVSGQKPALTELK